ncbi:AAA family ATPase [Vibrio fluvialis]|uniref:AAA family ATPase n=1 Tax=Vibrio fluvialis TaxID=676 RepID=UPI001EE9CBC7|nr:AAA family ATPase [Vibrio fluvialis]MCG6351324.1 AAA family ATPase [Vibrio fluvialis]
MIDAIEIKNFKSALDLSLELGRVNVFIGENGSGKSTVLEALTMAGAAESRKLDTEILELRGMRVTEPKFMFSAFETSDSEKKIEITLTIGDEETHSRKINIKNDLKTYSSWDCEFDFIVELADGEVISDSTIKNQINVLLEDLTTRKNKVTYTSKKINDEISELRSTNRSEFSEKLLKNLSLLNNENEMLQKLESDVEASMKRLKDLNRVSEILFMSIQRFVIYSPQNEQLRDVVKDSKLQPIGIYGEGLFKLLQVIQKEQPKAMQDVYKGLELFGWYQSMNLPNDISSFDDDLEIKDKYLSDSFNLKSTNEGFLYVLFYMALIVSQNTPKMFAIDNVDSALNPKLCSKIISLLTELAKKYNKQIFLTTHNPALIDGINLHDEDQKLYVISRNKFGHTKAKQITADKKPKDSETGEPMRLSEAFLRGYLGGLPKGF